MSVLIKGMEMPKGCASCFLKYGSCVSIRKRMDVSKGDRWCPENYRHPDCPLIEVTPHGRLIDADAVERNLVKMQMAQKGVVGHGIRKSRAVVRDMATVIEAESYSERELQRDYEASVEYAQHCGRYEPTYDPDTGAM